MIFKIFFIENIKVFLLLSGVLNNSMLTCDSFEYKISNFEVKKYGS